MKEYAVIKRKLVAIVVPLSTKPELSPEENVSLQHLKHFLHAYDKYAVLPKKLDVQIPGFKKVHFRDRFFGSVQAHNRLMLSKDFYQTFSAYKYILIYHPDSLVFSDQLSKWCELDWDYIAAPWVEYSGECPVGFSKCGNGGFSLRKVESFLNVIEPPQQCITANDAMKMMYAKRSRVSRSSIKPLKYLLLIKTLNRSWWVRKFYRRNEDKFWSEQASIFDPSFQVAPVEVGIQFAFDDAPRFCYKQNGRKLPFGCHGWYKYDRPFWESHLEKGTI